MVSTIPLMKIREIPIHNISHSPYQPRKDFGDVEALATNIREHKLQQPITVRKISRKKYELISGARRLEAVKLLGWEKIPANIIEASDQEAAAMCLSENVQRTNLNPIEESLGYKILEETFNMTHEEIAVVAGKSRPAITNSLSLLNIDEFLQACLICGKLSISHVRLITSAPPEIPKYRLADIAIDWNLNVKELEKIIQCLKESKKAFFWTRELPITRISIPLSLAKRNLDDDESIVVYASRVLLSGLDGILKARKRGDKTVIADIVYFTEWLLPSEAWTTIEPKDKIEKGTCSKFAQVLEELIGDREEMLVRYPIHSISHGEDLLVFQT